MRAFGRIPFRDPNTQFLAVAVLVGLLGAGGAIVFRWLTARITTMVTGHADIVDGARALPTVACVVVPAVGGLLGGFVARRFVRIGGTMGIAQIMEVVTIGRRTVRFRQSAARTLSSLLVISTGGSEGREGPIIQMAAAFASAVGRLARVSPERSQILVACGMAAGVAGAYNTPISATLFVMELVVGSFSMAIFGPVVVSAVVSSVTTRAALGDEPLYRVAPFHIESARELVPYVALGLLAGGCAVLFTRTLRLAKRAFKATGWRDEIRMALGGAGVGLLGLWLPEVWGNGFEGTNRILDGHVGLALVVALCAGKMLATALTIGSGGVGGVFTPGLMVGATLGGTLGLIAARVAPGFAAPVSSFALLGMGGILAGTTRAPFLAIIMMFELTDSPALVLPMMIVSTLAIVAARLFEPVSIYVEELREAGVHWRDTPEDTALASLRVRDVMQTHVRAIPETLPIGDIIRIFLETRELFLYVLSEAGALVGVVDLHDVKKSLGDGDLGGLVIAADVAQETPFVLVDEPLASVNATLAFRDYGQLPVVASASDRRLLGVVTRRDVLGAFDREVLQRDRLLAGKKRGPRLEWARWPDLPEEHRLETVAVPRAFVGSTLASSAIGRRFGVLVLAIRRKREDGTDRSFVPSADERLESGDELLVLAKADALGRLECAEHG